MLARPLVCSYHPILERCAYQRVGKATVYHALQDHGDTLTPEELAVLDARIAGLRIDITNLKAEDKTLKAQLAELSTTISKAALNASVEALEKTHAGLEAKLVGFKNGAIKAVSTEEKAEVDKSVKLWTYKAATTRKTFWQMWDTVREGLPVGKTEEDVWVGTAIFGTSFGNTNVL